MSDQNCKSFMDDVMLHGHSILCGFPNFLLIRSVTQFWKCWQILFDADDVEEAGIGGRLHGQNETYV
jgi:hypothetical protein